MGVLYSPESPYAQERVKWEAQNSEMGAAKRPYVYREFPMLLHRAGRPANGLGADAIVEQREAGSEVQEDLWRSEGFRRTPLEALAAFEGQQLEIAKLAAERNYDVAFKLSEKAGNEVALAEAHHSGHMATMPVTPIKKRVGRPAKAKD